MVNALDVSSHYITLKMAILLSLNHVYYGTARFYFADFYFRWILNRTGLVIFEPGYPSMWEYYQTKAESVLLI